MPNRIAIGLGVFYLPALVILSAGFTDVTSARDQGSFLLVSDQNHVQSQSRPVQPCRS